MNKKMADDMNLYIIPKQGTVPLAGNNQKAKIVGEVVINLEINGKLHRGIVAEVIENLCTDIIIGRDRLQKHRRVIFNFNGPEDDLIIGAVPQHSEDRTLNQPSAESSTTQSANLSPPTSLPPNFGTVNIPTPPLFTNLSKNIKPIATKSRRQAPANLRFMKEEVAKLYKAGIIRPSISSWRAQAFTTKGDGVHKRRMVIDYSETINLFTELDAYPMPNVLKMVEDISQYRYFSTFDLKSAYHQIPIKPEDSKYTAFEVDGQLWEFVVIPFGVTNGVSAFQRTIDKVILKEELRDTFAFVDNITVCGRTKEEHDRNVTLFRKLVKKYNFTLNEEQTVTSVETISVLGYTISHKKITPDQDRLKPLLEMPPPSSLKAQKRITGMFAYYSKFIQNFSEKIHPLNHNTTFPVPDPVLNAFRRLKLDLRDAALKPVDFDKELVLETDASDFCIAATLNQEGRPIAFFSRTLNTHEINHHSVEKEAAAIVESIREWQHFLLGRKFKLVTDQKSISFMFNNNRKSKIKNVKIARWRLELSQYKFDIKYRPGKDNVAADTFSRIATIGHPRQELTDLHEQLCHPGVSRLSHFVRSRNLPFTTEQVKAVTNSCKSCMYLKPQFLRAEGTLIKATAPFQRLSVDFKGPLPQSSKGNQYLFTLIDEYSRFPFAYPCRDMSSRTVIQCFNHLFSIFGMPDMVHNDRATDFLSEETQSYLLGKSIATSKTSRYNPQGNGQVEKLNGTLWKAVQVTLHSRKLKSSDWEDVLPDALHSIRSLLCTATNETPHERLFNFTRKSTSGKTIPSWVKPGPVYIRNQPKRSKNDPPVTSATLIHANPQYAHVRLQSGVETTVSLRDVSRHPDSDQQQPSVRDWASDSYVDTQPTLSPQRQPQHHQPVHQQQHEPEQQPQPHQQEHSQNQYINNKSFLQTQDIPSSMDNAITDTQPDAVRRSCRTTKLPGKFDGFVMG